MAWTPPGLVWTHFDCIPFGSMQQPGWIPVVASSNLNSNGNSLCVFTSNLNVRFARIQGSPLVPFWMHFCWFSRFCDFAETVLPCRRQYLFASLGGARPSLFTHGPPLKKQLCEKGPLGGTPPPSPLWVLWSGRWLPPLKPFYWSSITRSVGPRPELKAWVSKLSAQNQPHTYNIKEDLYIYIYIYIYINL